MPTLADMINPVTEVTVAGQVLRIRAVPIARVFSLVKAALIQEAATAGEKPPKGLELNRQAEKRLGANLPKEVLAPLLYAGMQGLNDGVVESMVDAEALTTVRNIDCLDELMDAVMGETDEAEEADTDGTAADASDNETEADAEKKTESAGVTS